MAARSMDRPGQHQHCLGWVSGPGCNASIASLIQTASRPRSPTWLPGDHTQHLADRSCPGHHLLGPAYLCQSQADSEEARTRNQSEPHRIAAAFHSQQPNHNGSLHRLHRGDDCPARLTSQGHARLVSRSHKGYFLDNFSMPTILRSMRPCGARIIAFSPLPTRTSTS